MRHLVTKQPKKKMKTVTLNIPEDSINAVRKTSKVMKEEYDINLSIGEIIGDLIEHVYQSNEAVYTINGEKEGMQDILKLGNQKIEKLKCNLEKVEESLEKKYEEIKEEIKEEIEFEIDKGYEEMTNEEKEEIEEQFDNEFCDRFEEKIDDILNDYILKEYKLDANYIEIFEPELYTKLTRECVNFNRFKEKKLNYDDFDYISIVLYKKNMEYGFNPISTVIDFLSRKEVCEFTKNKKYFFRMKNDVEELIEKYGNDVFRREDIKELIENKITDFDFSFKDDIFDFSQINLILE